MVSAAAPSLFEGSEVCVPAGSSIVTVAPSGAFASTPSRTYRASKVLLILKTIGSATTTALPSTDENALRVSRTRFEKIGPSSSGGDSGTVSSRDGDDSSDLVPWYSSRTCRSLHSDTGQLLKSRTALVNQASRARHRSSIVAGLNTQPAPNGLRMGCGTLRPA